VASRAPAERLDNRQERPARQFLRAALDRTETCWSGQGWPGAAATGGRAEQFPLFNEPEDSEQSSTPPPPVMATPVGVGEISASGRMPENPVAQPVEREPVPALPTPADLPHVPSASRIDNPQATPIEKSANTATPVPALRAMAQELVRELVQVHPTPGNGALAVPIVECILAAAKDAKAEVERIRRSHASWRDYWNLRGPGFVRYLFGWFQQGDWEYEAKFENLRKPVTRAVRTPLVFGDSRTPARCAICKDLGFLIIEQNGVEGATPCQCRQRAAA